MINKTLILFMFISGFISWWILAGYQNALQKPIVLSKPIVVEIERGESFSQVCKKLLDLDIGINRFWFNFIAISEQLVKKLKPGEYELKSGQTMPQLLDLFVQGKARQYAITFPEGRNFKEILQEIAKNPNIDHTLLKVEGRRQMAERVSAIFCSPSFEQSPQFSVPCPLSSDPDGLLFPDTYFFEKRTTDLAILKRAFNRMQAVLQHEWQNRASNLAVETPYQALILASIVEKETAATAERSLIAGVFTRRLQIGMLLQTDPTVIYGMGENYHGNISSENLTTITAYNTYKIKGLPPTPIAMPGRDAIYAALHPDNSNKLYFVARGDGTHEFSATLEEHNRAVNSYQRKK